MLTLFTLIVCVRARVCFVLGVFFCCYITFTRSLHSRTFCCCRVRRNGDGYIDREEFALIIRSTGEAISEEEIDELLKEGDKNSDGMLDFDGMCQMKMMKLSAHLLLNLEESL